MGLKLVTAPANDPVSLVEAKAHLREDSDDFNLQIEAFIKAATQFVDGPKGFLGRALIDQTWDLYLDRFPCWGAGAVQYLGTGHQPYHQHGLLMSRYIEIPLAPLIEILGVFYLDGNGDEQELSASRYVVDSASEPARLVLATGSSWPIVSQNINAVRIRFRAGYINAANSPASDNVPFVIKAAILLCVGDLYQNRENTIVGESVTTIPWSAEQLLRPHRLYLGMA